MLAYHFPSNPVEKKNDIYLHVLVCKHNGFFYFLLHALEKHRCPSSMLCIKVIKLFLLLECKHNIYIIKGTGIKRRRDRDREKIISIVDTTVHLKYAVKYS